MRSWYDQIQEIARLMRAAEDLNRSSRAAEVFDRLPRTAADLAASNFSLVDYGLSSANIYPLIQNSFSSISAIENQLLSPSHLIEPDMARSMVAYSEGISLALNPPSSLAAEVIKHADLSRISLSHSDLISAYRQITDQSIRFSLPPILQDLSTLELFNSAHVYGDLWEIEDSEFYQDEEEQDETKSTPLAASEVEFISLLGQIRYEYRDIWIGGKEALRTGNRERVRHGLTSYRELLNSLLTEMATNEEVGKWTVDPAYFRDGRPTPRARIDYVCRFASQPRFSGFVHVDTRDIHNLIHLCNQGTHELKSSLTEEQILSIENRLRDYIKYLITIWRACKN